MSKELSVVALNKELSKQLADPAVVRALLATTFKEFDEKLMRQAMLEGMFRGFSFKNFLQKDLYAIKYRDKQKNIDTYSLITSIDFARKIGMRSGVVGKSAPTFEIDGKKLVSCSITIKRRVGKDIGEFTSLVYFDEYNTSKNQWVSKPRTMIAKVAEMHALRMACPEEMSQLYTSKEFDKEKEDDYDHSPIDDDAVPTIHIGDDHGTPPPNLILDRSSTTVKSKDDEEFWDEPEVRYEQDGKNTKS